MFTFSNFCILCLTQPKNLINIFLSDNNGITVAEKLKCFLFDLVQLTPEIPKYICMKCLENVNNVYNFKQNCLKSFTSLNEYLKTLKAVDGTYKKLLVTLTDPCNIVLRNTRSQKNGPRIRKQDHTVSKLHVCDTCGKTFHETYRLNRHKMQVHKALPPRFRCNICHHRFFKAEYLELHKNSHLGLRTCTQCKQTFKKRTDLDRHREIHHRKIICTTCNETFSSEYNLRKHRTTHRTCQEFRCSICQKTFNTSYQLRKHRKSHQKETKQKQSQCTRCPAKFNTANELARHRKVHTVEKIFQCDICQCTRSRMRDLVVHRRLHTGERPFACTKCPKKFICNKTLRKHILKCNYHENYTAEHTSNVLSTCDKENYQDNVQHEIKEKTLLFEDLEFEFKDDVVKKENLELLFEEKIQIDL